MHLEQIESQMPLHSRQRQRNEQCYPLKDFELKHLHWTPAQLNNEGRRVEEAILDVQDGEGVLELQATHSVQAGNESWIFKFGYPHDEAEMFISMESANDFVQIYSGIRKRPESDLHAKVLYPKLLDFIQEIIRQRGIEAAHTVIKGNYAYSEDHRLISQEHWDRVFRPILTRYSYTEIGPGKWEKKFEAPHVTALPEAA